MGSESRGAQSAGSAQAPSGDYGYDLVHEDLAAATGSHRQQGPGAASPAPTPDPGGDHGYDEAHDF